MDFFIMPIYKQHMAQYVMNCDHTNKTRLKLDINGRGRTYYGIIDRLFLFCRYSFFTTCLTCTSKTPF